MRLIVLGLTGMLIAFYPSIARSQEGKSEGSSAVKPGDPIEPTRADASVQQRPAPSEGAGVRRSSVPIVAGDLNGARIKPDGGVVNQNGKAQ